MSPAAVLVLIVRISGIDGAEAQLDRGLVDGLRVGDSGAVFYELSVGADTKRIDVGEATVISADESEARCLVPAGARAGSLVRFEVPADRVGPAALLELARTRLAPLEGAECDEALRRWVDRLFPAADGLEEDLVRILSGRRPGPSDGRPVGTAAASGADASATAMVQVPGGRYLIGRALVEASFYNQYPRFEIELPPFQADAGPVTRGDFAVFRPDLSAGGVAAASEPVGGVTWDEADEFCRWRGAGLPTELQWEAGMSAGLLDAGLLEWTASWYRPYPGNRVAEPEYGETVRVIRGSADPTERPLHRRLFAPLETLDSRLGFRCASSDR